MWTNILYGQKYVDTPVFVSFLFQCDSAPVNKSSSINWLTGLHRVLTPTLSSTSEMNWNADCEPDLITNISIGPHWLSGGWIGVNPCSQIPTLVERLKPEECRLLWLHITTLMVLESHVQQCVFLRHVCAFGFFSCTSEVKPRQKGNSLLSACCTEGHLMTGISLICKALKDTFCSGFMSD